MWVPKMIKDIELHLNDEERQLLLQAVNHFNDMPDFRDPYASNKMKLLRAKVMVAISE